MILTRQHIELLKELSKGRDEGIYETDYAGASKEIRDALLVLEMEGFVNLRSPLVYSLGYFGEAILNIYESLVDKGALPRWDEWSDTFRWVGSEVIAAIESAVLGGKVDRATARLLEERGFYVNGELTPEAHELFEVYRRIHPRLVISSSLADYIRKIPPGPASKSMLPVGANQLFELEAMRLLAFSVPASDVYALTGLGQAVRGVLLKTYPASPVIIDESIMTVFKKAFDEGFDVLDDSAKNTMVELGYFDSSGEVLPAGESLSEVIRIYETGPRRTHRSFHIEEIEIETLETIESLWGVNRTNPEIVPDRDWIRKYLMEKKRERVMKFMEKVGGDIGRVPLIRRKAYREVREIPVERWFDKYFDLTTILYTLESFDLIEAFEHPEYPGRRVYSLTELGKRVLEDRLKNNFREVSSAAVKAVTVTRKEFSAPNIEWYERAVEEGLVGSGAPSESGLLMAYVAENIKRKPHLTALELKILHRIPEKGVLVDEVLELVDEDPVEVRWALEKMEARMVLDILPGGGVVLTCPGKKLKKALAGVPESVKHPINPLLVRVLEALRKVGTIYEKERKIRVLPSKFKEALKLSGLDANTFDEMLRVARSAKFVGSNSLNESGMLILEAFDEMGALRS